MTKEMVRVESRESIFTLFKHLSKINPFITLWQNLGEPSRRKHLVTLKKLDEHKQEMIFYPKGDYFSFDSTHPIYFFSPKRTTIFKNRIFYNSSYQLAIKVPEIIMIRNVRNQPRNESDEMVHFMFGDERISKDCWFKSPLLDRSVGGLSFRSSINNIIKFKTGQKIKYRFESMPKYILGEIVNVVELGDPPYNKICVKKT